MLRSSFAVRRSEYARPCIDVSGQEAGGIPQSTLARLYCSFWNSGDIRMSERKPVGEGGSDTAVVLSIIIATYNAQDLLADCLQSIYQNPPSEPYEIIVVDDASKDATSAMVRSRFPEVRLFRNEVNSHYATSNNRAFEHARGRYFYLLNNDTIMLPNALDAMIAFLREHPDAGSVGSKLLNEDGSIQWSVKTLPNIGSAAFGARSLITRFFPNNPFSRKHLQHMGRDMTTPFVAGYVSSASVMMPREVVAKVGGLDRRLSYHVDADYCKRISNEGYNNYYLPTATVVHLNHRGGTMVSPRRRFLSVVEFHRGSMIYFQKHMSQTASLPMRIVVVGGLLGRFVMSMAIQSVAELGRSSLRLARKLANGRREPAAKTR
jgi:GT2 family glycosyltransferase